MIYEFSHYPTDSGRRVRFIVGRAELQRVRRAGYMEGEQLRGVEVIELGSRAEVMLVMAPAVARIMVDVLAMVGGDAAVAARMLSTALDGMVDELRVRREVDGLVNAVQARRNAWRGVRA